jgi:pyoverdine/dityrosine biosynthesis protein Dit1
LGEVLALERLEALCRDIEAVYPPGARVVVCSDGRVFSDLVRVRDSDVDGYAAGILGILHDRGLTHIDTYNLEDVFADSDYDDMRASLTRDYGRPVREIRAEVMRDEEARRLFNGIHRFLFEDQLALDPHLSRNKVRESAKETSYRVIQRSNAWSSLLADHFPAAVRLSIHPQPARSAKLGVKLVPGGDLWSTPWHNVVLAEGDSVRLVKRREAEALGAKVVHADGKYAYFSLGGIRETC